MRHQHPDNFLLTSRQFTTNSATIFLQIVTIANRFGRKDPLLARAPTYKSGQKQQIHLMKTNLVGATDSAHGAEKQWSFCRNF
jgi:hypothetical protein